MSIIRRFRKQNDTDIETSYILVDPSGGNSEQIGGYRSNRSTVLLQSNGVRLFPVQPQMQRPVPGVVRYFHGLHLSDMGSRPELGL